MGYTVANAVIESKNNTDMAQILTHKQRATRLPTRCQVTKQHRRDTDMDAEQLCYTVVYTVVKSQNTQKQHRYEHSKKYATQSTHNAQVPE